MARGLPERRILFFTMKCVRAGGGDKIAPQVAQQFVGDVGGPCEVFLQ